MSHANQLQLVKLVESLAALADDMDDDAEALDKLPGGLTYSQEHLAVLDEVRHSALRLADRAGAVIKNVQGG